MRMFEKYLILCSSLLLILFLTIGCITEKYI